MKKNKQFLFITVFFCFSLLFLSCGGDDDNESNATKNQENVEEIKYSFINAQELMELVKTHIGSSDESLDFTIIDIRMSSDYTAGSIPYSVNIPITSAIDRDGEFRADGKVVTEEVPDKARRVVIYCDGAESENSNTRCHTFSGKMADMLDYTNVLAYWGGMLKWKEAGYWWQISYEGVDGEKENIAGGITKLIDFRSTESFTTEHIEGAENFPLADSDAIPDIAEALKDVDKETKIIVYCEDSTCNAGPDFSKDASEAGYINVYWYKNGMSDYKTNNESN